jgi:hypothetical protein
MIRTLQHGVVALLVATIWIGWWPWAASAQTERPLSDLLRATHVHGLAVDRGRSGTLLIATHHGLHALDLETGMTEQLSEHVDDLMGFTPHPTDPDTLFASGHPALGGNLGFIASTDGGRSWTRLSPGVDGPVDFHQIDVSPADHATVYGAYAGRLQVSRDGGQSWQVVGPAPEGLVALAASAEDANVLYAATQAGLLKSADGGRSWQDAYWLRQPATTVQVTAASEVYAFLVGTGLVRTGEPDLAWQPVSDGFGEAYLLHLTVDPAEPGNLFVVSVDPRSHQQSLLASRDRGTTWSALGSGTD